MAPFRETASRVWRSLEAGGLVAGTAGLVRAAFDLEVVSALQTSHQVIFVAITWSAWACAGALVSGIFGASSAVLPARPGVRRTWAGWPALVVFLAIDLGIGELGLDHGASLGALGISAFVLLQACKRLGNKVPGLESPWAWGASGQLLLVLCVWEIAGEPPARHGLDPTLLLLLAGPFVLSLPAVIRRLRVRAASTLVMALGSVTLLVGSLAALVAAGAQAEEKDLPNVLLVTIDTLRTDAVGCYGGASASTPTLDRLAEEGVLFEDVHSQVPMTYPSHTSILSGLYPGSHGVLNNMPWPLRDGVDTLPDVFARRGYLTAAVVSGFTVKRDAAQLHQRFQVYDDTFGPLRVVPDRFVDSGLVLFAHLIGDLLGLELRRLRYGGDRPAQRCIDSALEWTRRARGPFFLWVHLFDPHLPYEPPAEHVQDRSLDAGGRDGFWYRVPPAEKLQVVRRERDVEGLRALYRGEVTYADQELGVLLDLLRSEGRYANTLVIATSDHGESLGEHDYWFDHSYFLYETCLRVPLIVRVPESLRGGDFQAPGSREETSVRLIDVAPTVVDLLSVEGLRRRLDGVSLVPLLRGGESASDAEPSYAVTYDLRADRRRYLLSVRDGRWKYVRTAARWDDLWLVPESEQLFDLQADPGETRERSSLPESSDTVARMRALADVHWRDWAPPDVAGPELSEKDQAQLEAIGY